MDGIVEYAQHEMDGFGQTPPNEVDSLVFSQLCYLWFGEAFPDTRGIQGRTLHDCFHAERFDPLFVGKRAEEQNLKLLTAAAASPRFRDVRVCRYTSEVNARTETQFCAVTFILPEGNGAYIAFRGTDSTLVGWKENFNLAYRYPVPGQVHACTYLNDAADAIAGTLYVGGHSKGGNLAEYAATQCSASVQDRIALVFDHDAPGFEQDFYGHPAFTRIAGRIRKTIPQDALVGMLMDTVQDYRVVMSDGVAMAQHDPFTWGVDIDSRDFQLADGISRAAGRGDAVISTWIEPLDRNERGVFIDTLFRALEATGARKMRDLRDIDRHGLAAATAVLRDTDPKTRQIMVDILKRLAILFVTPRASWNLLDGGADVKPQEASRPEAASALATASIDGIMQRLRERNWLD